MLPHSQTDSESGIIDAKENAGVVIKNTWKGRIWDTWDLPRKERRMLFKVDAVLLTLCSVSLPLAGCRSCSARLLFEES
jgi:hypothetical protein